MATMSEPPLEIIEIILLKLLLVKSLLRFKSVSKSWHALISDPIFIQNHHQNSISSNPHNLFLCSFSSPQKQPSPYDLSVVKLDGGKFETLEPNIKGLPGSLNRVVCFGDGVLLLSNTILSRYVLFNPSTRIYAKLENQFNSAQFAWGLCRDPTTGDFKVVAIVTRSCYAVYSCKKKTWTYREPTITLRVYSNKAGVSVDGAIYGVSEHYNDIASVIICFDPRDDTLKILPKPKDVDDEKGIWLVNLRSSLCLYCNGKDTKTVQIWTKEKGIDNNSWKKLMTIPNVNIPIGSVHPQCFLGDKVLIWNKYISIRNKESYKLQVYSPSEKTFERFEDIKLYGLGLIPYMDTLFLPITITRPKRKRKGLH